MVGPCVLLSLGFPPMAAGQDCRVNDGPGHADWHAGYQEKSKLLAEIARRANEAGLEDSIRGWIFFAPDEDRLYLVDNNLPAPVQQRLPQLLAEYFMRMASDVGSLSLELDAPEVPLWPDRTEVCNPVLENPSVVTESINNILERRSETVGSARVILRLFVGHTGEVARVVVDREVGAPWLDEELESLRSYFRYRPTRLNGVPVGAWVRQDFAVSFE